MYAIILDGGRQFKVEAGQTVLLDYRDLPAGTSVEFDQVLACRDESGLKIGRPTLAGAKVTAEVVGSSQGPKLVVQKVRRRKTLRRKTGHRQIHTEVRIKSIVA